MFRWGGEHGLKFGATDKLRAIGLSFQESGILVRTIVSLAVVIVVTCARKLLTAVTIMLCIINVFNEDLTVFILLFAAVMALKTAFGESHFA